MKTVLILRGLPGSGKSTFARQRVAEAPNTWKRINRDDLRTMLDDGFHSKGNENFVKKVRDMLIIKALEEGKHVIVDDTNLVPATLEHLRALVAAYARERKEEVKVEEMLIDTPVEECIARDAMRTKPVGAAVIRKMHREFLFHEPAYRPQDENLPRAIICDLDGTLALMKGRNPYDASQCERDQLNGPVAQTIRAFEAQGCVVLFVSGRKDTFRPQTEAWLRAHGFTWERLLMRPAADDRKDSVLKREIFDTHIAGRYRIELVLDDRNQVVDMWRNELNLPCFQVYYGDF